MCDPGCQTQTFESTKSMEEIFGQEEALRLVISLLCKYRDSGSNIYSSHEYFQLFLFSTSSRLTSKSAADKI